MAEEDRGLVGLDVRASVSSRRANLDEEGSDGRSGRRVERAQLPRGGEAGVGPGGQENLSGALRGGSDAGGGG